MKKRATKRTTKRATPASYEKCVRRMYEAAITFLQQNPLRTLKFTDFARRVVRQAGVPDDVPVDKVAITAALGPVIHDWAADNYTQRFLLSMEVASGREATYMQASAVISLLQEQGIIKVEQSS
jgi:hypothetical protein